MRIYRKKIINFLNNRIKIIKLLDFFQSTHIFKYKAFLEKTQFWNSEELKKLQDRKLSNLLKWAYETVPFYKKQFNKLNFYPNITKNPRDKLLKIPIIKKSDIQENIHKFVSKKKIRYKIEKTSGSTGKPTKFLKDFNTISMGSACFYRELNWYGYNIGDPYVWLWGGRPVESIVKKFIEYIRNLLRNIKKFDTHRFNNEKLRQIYDYIKFLEPSIIYGYVSSIDLLAEFIDSKNLDPLEVGSIVTSAEKLQSIKREKFRKIFKTDIFDQYGTTEITSIAGECEKQLGLHINMEHVFLELIKDGERIVDPNIEGEVVLTDLDNYKMPLIRYNIEDIATFKKGICECGRESDLLSTVKGRHSDIIKGLNGNKVHGEFFAHLFESTNFDDLTNLKQFQVVQDNISHLLINLVVKRRPKYKKIRELKKIVFRYLGDIDIDFNFVDSIPRSESGKLKYVISQVN